MMFDWRNRTHAFALALAAAFLGGLLLRTYLLSDQILIDDEWHGLYYTIGKSPLWLLTRFSIPGATCMPLNFYNWAVGATVGWSEISLRLPALLGGVLCVVVCPWLARDLLGLKRSATLALLLAVSPLLIFYSRISRPYSLVALLCVATVLLAARWQQTGARRYAVWFVLTAVLAVYFHLFAVIAVAAPFLVTFALHLRARAQKTSPPGPPLRQWLIVGGVIALGCAALVLPALLASLRSTFFKVALAGKLYWSSVPEVAALFVGTSQPVLAFLVWAAVIAGAVELSRRQPWLAATLITLYPLHLIALIASRPDASQSAIVLARYCIPLVPVTLLLAACGLHAALAFLATRVPLRPAVPIGLVGAVTALLLLAGPLPQCYVAPNNFTSHGVYQHRHAIIDWQQSFRSDLTPPGFTLVSTVRADEVSPFYRELGGKLGTTAVVEYPMPIGDHFNPIYYYQHFHRRPVVIGYTTTMTNLAALPDGNIFGNTYIDQVLSLVPASTKLSFRHAVAMEDLDAMRARKVEYIIIHKRFEAQLPQVLAEPADMIRLAKLYREKIGAPVYQDTFIAVFKL